MDIKTFADLIAWTRQLHAHLAKCLARCSSQNEDERARLLLDYLAGHEAKIEKMVAAFEQQADPKTLHTYISGYLSNHPINKLQASDAPYATLGFDDICREVLDYHEQIIELLRNLMGTAPIPEAKTLLNALLDMEEHQAMLLAVQTGRMNDL
jgi:hypothetical protein